MANKTKEQQEDMQDISGSGNAEPIDQPGQKVRGYLTGYEVPDSNRDLSNILIIQTEAGEVKKYWSSKGLDDALTTGGAESGEATIKPTVKNHFVQIEYLGKKKIKGGKTFKQYRVLCSPGNVLSAENVIPF